MRRMKSLPVFILSMLVASTAFAKICKTVGPDGSVTYTDRPAASCADSNAESEASKASANAQKVAAVTPASEAQASDVANATTIERSVIAIMTLEDRVQRTYDACVQLQPTSIRRYGDAIDGWRERNAAATRKMNRALAQGFNGTQQRAIRDGVSKRNAQQIESMRASLASEQLKWCEQTTGDIENRSLDVAATLTAPLVSF
jgi:hypothetical protein